MSCGGQCGCGHGTSPGTDTMGRQAIGSWETVEEVVRQSPGAAEILRGLGIDTCCGGRLTLSQAAASAGLSIGTVLEALGAGSEDAA